MRPAYCLAEDQPPSSVLRFRDSVVP